jgi:hypothetical protein
MTYKEVISRITGFSVPIFGISWNPPEPEIATARRVLTYLEDRRVLYNPHHIEVEHECIHSVLEIRQVLTEAIGHLPESKLAEHLKAIRAACRNFLDDTNPKSRRIRPYWSSNSESAFFTALGELRATIGIHIGAIAIMYGLSVEAQLASVLPEAPDGSDDSPGQMAEE